MDQKHALLKEFQGFGEIYDLHYFQILYLQCWYSRIVIYMIIYSELILLQ